jgi:hypothetical protein
MTTLDVRGILRRLIMPAMTGTAFDRDSMANWYAQHHGEIDPGVVEIHYLPTNAGPREIRFLEVNELISETTPLEPIDFGVDVGSDNAHKLNVLDVTPAQWEAIRTEKMPLPEGWALDDRRQIFKRQQTGR